MKQIIYLAGGCFWGVDAYFKEIEGVDKTQVGYANGLTEDTFYENLKNSDHAETVKVTYDDSKISLERLLEYFYYIIDPFSVNKQGADMGRQYRTGIYSEDGKTLEKVRKFLEEKKKRKRTNPSRSRKTKKLYKSRRIPPRLSKEKSKWLLPCQSIR